MRQRKLIFVLILGCLATQLCESIDFKKFATLLEPKFKTPVHVGLLVCMSVGYLGFFLEHVTYTFCTAASCVDCLHICAHHMYIVCTGVIVKYQYYTTIIFLTFLNLGPDK